MWELLVIKINKIFINYKLAVTKNLLPEVKEPTHSSVLSHLQEEIFWEYLQSRITPSEKETINYAIMQISIQYWQNLPQFNHILIFKILQRYFLDIIFQ